MEYDASAARIKEAADLDKPLKEAAKIGPRCSGAPGPLIPATRAEGRHIGHKSKRPLEDEYPPQKRAHMARPRSPSHSVEPAYVALGSTGDSGSESGESLASCRHIYVAGAISQEPMVVPRTQVVEDDALENQAGPSVSKSAPRGPRKLTAKRGYNLRELNLRPLNEVFKVDAPMPMMGKLKHMLRLLGRPVIKDEIMDALNMGWPKENINDVSEFVLLGFYH